MGQSIVYQFTGTANGEIDDVPFAGKLVRIELVGLVANNTHGAVQVGTDGSEESATVISSGFIRGWPKLSVGCNRNDYSTSG